MSNKSKHAGHRRHKQCHGAQKTVTQHPSIHLSVVQSKNGRQRVPSFQFELSFARLMYTQFSQH